VLPAEMGSVMDDAAISARGLTKAFGVTRMLTGVDLTVAPGTLLALLGPNGSGKTTTVRILTTLLPADGGAATVAGHDVRREGAAVRRSILLTTQYLEEADQLADRIAVINNGRIVADDTPNALKRQTGSERLLLRLERPEDLRRAGAPLVRAEAGPHLDADAGEVTMAIRDPEQLRHALVRLHEAGIGVAQVELRTPTLDDVCFELTKAAA
jgi:ABC-type multidrug transport system ATPase subunit